MPFAPQLSHRRMLPAIMALAIIVAASSAASAQTTTLPQEGNWVGLKIGFNRSTMTTNFDNYLGDGIMGLVGGGYIRVALRPSFSIQPEILFSQKGVSGLDGGFLGVEIRTNYVEGPFLARFEFPTEGNARPYVLAGPAVGFLLSGSVRESGRDENQFDRDDFRSVELGLVLGGGVDLNGFGVEARFQTGSNVAVDDDFALVGASLNNRVFSIQLSVPLR